MNDPRTSGLSMVISLALVVIFLVAGILFGYLFYFFALVAFFIFLWGLLVDSVAEAIAYEGWLEIGHYIFEPREIIDALDSPLFTLEEMDFVCDEDFFAEMEILKELIPHVKEEIDKLEERKTQQLEIEPEYEESGEEWEEWAEWEAELSSITSDIDVAKRSIEISQQMTADPEKALKEWKIQRGFD